MYHAPLSADAPVHDDLPVEAPDEEINYEEGNHRLREAHLQNGQAQATALFAPFLAASGVGAAVLAAWAMYSHAPLQFIVGWLCVVGFGHWITYRRAVEAGTASGSRAPSMAPAGNTAVAVLSACSTTQ